MWIRFLFVESIDTMTLDNMNWIDVKITTLVVQAMNILLGEAHRVCNGSSESRV